MLKFIKTINASYTQGQMPTAQLALIGVTQLAIARLVTNISKFKL